MRAPSLVAVADSPTAMAETAKEAEDAGFDSVWAPEFYDRSAVVSLAAMAMATSRVTLGSGIAYGFGRTPLVLATEAADVDRLSGGRLILGLGTGTKRMQTDWHGLDGEHPAARVEELVPLLRRLWRLREERSIDHEGRFYRLKLRPTAPPVPPLRADIPVYLAGVGRRMVEAAGAVADGLVGHPLFTPEYVAEVVRPALASRGRDVPIAGYVICAVADDADVARSNAAAQIAFYSTVATYDPIHELHGFTDEVAAIRSAWRSGDLAGMVGAVTDRMVDAMAAAGTAADVRRIVEDRFAPSYDRVLLYPPTLGGDGRTATSAVIDAFRT